MTDRPTLEDLDADPDAGPWCCTGNVEDCALCTNPNPPYPFICGGHERTAANERAVSEAAQAAEAVRSTWTQLEERAFKAVLPALHESGDWLPPSVRRAVATAVLGEVKRELAAFAAQYEAATDRTKDAGDLEHSPSGLQAQTPSQTHATLNSTLTEATEEMK